MTRSGRYFAVVLLFSAMTSISAITKAPAAKPAAAKKASGSDATTKPAPAGSVVFCDMAKILGPVQEEFVKERDAMQKEIQVKMIAFQKEKEAHEAKKNDVKDKKAHEDKGKEIDSRIESTGQSFQMRMMAVQKSAESKAKAVVEKVKSVLKKFGWAAILPAEATLAYDDSLDMTNVIMKELNIK